MKIDYEIIEPKKERWLKNLMQILKLNMFKFFTQKMVYGVLVELF